MILETLNQVQSDLLRHRDRVASTVLKENISVFNPNRLRKAADFSLLLTWNHSSKSFSVQLLMVEHLDRPHLSSVRTKRRSQDGWTERQLVHVGVSPCATSPQAREGKYF